MRLTNDYWLYINRTKTFASTNITGVETQHTKQDEIKLLWTLRSAFNSSRYSETRREELLHDIAHKLEGMQALSQKAEERQLTQDDIDMMTASIQQLTNFFKEFDFTPNFRFINTFAHIAKRSAYNAYAYCVNYFKLTDNPNAAELEQKAHSAEFDGLVSQFALFNPSTCINKRFALYYGAQGTGKTTQAMNEANGNVMVCHSAMLPSDLMEDFKFEDGHPNFTHSALWKAMENGEPIVLDEINLLPFESLRFLQSILDGKTQFEYKGQTVEIKDGFKIYGTMNLTVNGQIYPLPEPLVDRADTLKEFALTADMLVGALI